MAGTLVSVIVPTYSRPVDWVVQCLESIFSQTRVTFEVLLVEDGSPLSILPEIKKRVKDPRLKMIRIAHSGAALARNTGIEEAKGEFLAFTDDDCIVQKEWLYCLVEPLRQSEKIVGVGGIIYSANSDNSFLSRYTRNRNFFEKPLSDVDGSIGTIITANAAFRRSSIVSLGGFSNIFFQAGVWVGGEDMELSFRLKQNGGTLAFAPEAIVLHRYRDGLKTLLLQYFCYGQGVYLHSSKNKVPLSNTWLCHPDMPEMLVNFLERGLYKIPTSIFKDIQNGWGIVESILFALVDSLKYASFLLGARNIFVGNSKLKCPS